jgi:hypothetical protein
VQNRVLLLLPVLDGWEPKDEDEPPIGFANDVGIDGLGIEGAPELSDGADGPLLKNAFTGGVKRKYSIKIQITTPTMPPIEPEAATTMVPNRDRMLKIKLSVLAQPLPSRKPQPVSSQIIPKKITTPPIMYPMLASRPPTPKPRLANIDEKAAMVMPPINPTMPVSIASIAIIVTPIGLGDFCMKAGEYTTYH